MSYSSTVVRSSSWRPVLQGRGSVVTLWPSFHLPRIRHSHLAGRQQQQQQQQKGVATAAWNARFGANTIPLSFRTDSRVSKRRVASELIYCHQRLFTSSVNRSKWLSRDKFALSYRLFGTIPPKNDDDDNDNEKKNSKEKNHHSQHHDTTTSPPARTTLQSFVVQLRSPPNIITMGRIISIPYISHLIFTDQYGLAMMGCGLAAASDYADGYVAKTYNCRTTLGSYLDPLADKLAINVLAGSLYWHAPHYLLPGWIFALWLARDVGLMVFTCYFVKRWMDSDRNVVDPGTIPFKVEPTDISKVNTVLQFVTIGSAMVVGLYDGMGHEYVTGLCYITAGTTIASAFSYLGGGSIKLSDNKRDAKESSHSSPH